MPDTERIATCWRLLRDKALDHHYGSREIFVNTVNAMVQKLPKKSLRKSLSKYHDDVCDLFGLPPDPFIDEDENKIPPSKRRSQETSLANNLNHEDSTELGSAAGKGTGDDVTEGVS